MRQIIAHSLRAIAQRFDPKPTASGSRLNTPGDALVNALLQFQNMKTPQGLAILITAETYELLAVDRSKASTNHSGKFQATSIDTIDDICLLPLSVTCAAEAIQKLSAESGHRAFPEPEPGSFWAANISLLQLLNTALSIALTYGTPCPFLKGYSTYRDSYLSVSANPSNGAVFVVVLSAAMGGSDRVLDLSETNVLECYIPHLRPDEYEGAWEDRLTELLALLSQQKHTEHAEAELPMEARFNGTHTV